MDQVIPSLLAGLEGPKPEQALEGLRVILGVRPATLNTMLPKLLKPPMSATELAALGALAEVAGARTDATGLRQDVGRVKKALYTLASPCHADPVPQGIVRVQGHISKPSPPSAQPPGVLRPLCRSWPMDAHAQTFSPPSYLPFVVVILSLQAWARHGRPHWTGL